MAKVQELQVSIFRPRRKHEEAIEAADLLVETRAFYPLRSGDVSSAVFVFLGHPKLLSRVIVQRRSHFVEDEEPPRSFDGGFRKSWDRLRGEGYKWRHRTPPPIDELRDVAVVDRRLTRVYARFVIRHPFFEIVRELRHLHPLVERGVGLADLVCLSAGESSERRGLSACGPPRMIPEVPRVVLAGLERRHKTRAHV